MADAGAIPMAERGSNAQQDAISPADVVTAARTALLGTGANAALRSRLNAIHARRDTGIQAATTIGEPTEQSLNQELLLSLLVTAANGEYDLPKQTVNVEYLRNEQRLLIPAPMGYNLLEHNESESRIVDDLLNRYYRVALTPYAEIVRVVSSANSLTRIRQYVDALQLPDRIDISTSWLTTGELLLDNGDVEDPDNATIVLSTLSQALLFNCDIRDVGYLSGTDARVTDTAWVDFEKVPMERLKLITRPYTNQMVAALNYPNVGKNALAAWVRAFGLGAGILPSRTSRTQIEYQFTYAIPAVEFRTTLTTFESNAGFDIRSVCMNVLALFGLLHLNKDHTFKSNDSNMERICTSWVLTLRTMVSNDVMDYIRGSLEHICRTCAHPFGLAQTYWLAKVMGNLGLLSTPLAIRENITPPPVQRIMIIRAATREWATVPSGRQLNAIHRNQLLTLEKEYATIMASPTAYSGLFRLYGHPAMVSISKLAKDACDALMPMVYGFALAMHTDENQKKDGLALAMSLSNILRDNKVLAKSFESIWTNYLDRVARTGLVEFVNESAQILGVGSVGTE